MHDSGLRWTLGADAARAGGPRALAVAALAATAAALMAREWGWTGCCAVALAWLALRSYVARWGQCAAGWWLVVPAALAAVPDPPVDLATGEGPVRVAGRIAAVERWDPITGTGSVRVEAGGRGVRCVFADPADLARGDRIELAGRMKDETVQVAPGTLRCEPALDPGASLARGRAALQRRLVDALPGETGPLVASLAFGRGPLVAEDLSRAHRNTGLSHLLAVSGAHVAMIAWLLGQAFGGGWPMHRRSFRRVCAVLLLAYGGIAGLEAPVFRAVAGFLVGIWLGGHGRAVGLVTALAVPACLTCAVDPAGLFGISFCLSYSAVLGLTLAGPWGGSRWQRWVLTPVRASFWAMVTTTPWTCWYFSQWAPATLVGTPVLAPLVAMMLGGGLALSLLGDSAPVIGPALAWLVGSGASIYAEAVRALDALPATPVLAPGRPELTTILLCGALGLVLTARAGLRIRVLALCTGLTAPHFAPGDGRDLPAAMLLDVGHGQACVLRVDNQTVLVDCGSIPVPRRAAATVADALGHRRIIDRLVLTHADGDHTGAVVELLCRARVHEVVVARTMAHHPAVRAAVAAGVRLRTVESATTLDLGSLSVWCPPAHLRGNDASLWIRATTVAGSILLTGDAELRGVRAALDGADLAPVDVLLLPHHGREVHIEELLDVTRPRVALVSGPEDTARAGSLVRRRGIPTYYTATSGTLRWTHGAGRSALSAEGPISSWSLPQPP